MPYRVSTLLSRPAIVKELQLGERKVRVVVVNEEELKLLEELGVRGLVEVDERLLKLIKKFEQGSAQPCERQQLARSPYTPPPLLKLLADDEDVGVVEAVARNKRTPPSVLEQLARHRRFKVRRGVARNKATPPHVLERLARDRAVKVLRQVALNPNTPPHALERLASHRLPRVRKYVYYNRNCPQHVKEKLANEFGELL